MGCPQFHIQTDIAVNWPEYVIHFEEKQFRRQNVKWIPESTQWQDRIWRTYASNWLTKLYIEDMYTDFYTLISTATSWNWPMHAGKRRPSWAVNSNLRPSWAVNSSTFNKKCCKKIRVCNIFQRKNAPGGKRSSEYLCKLNDEAALGRVTTPSENTNLLEEMKWNDSGRQFWTSITDQLSLESQCQENFKIKLNSSIFQQKSLRIDQSM